MSVRYLWLILVALLMSGAALSQQSGGQVCVRAFEDRNANSLQDGGEPPITRGISATLANSENIIIDTRLMEDAPTAAQGTLCFQRLDPGQYTVRVLSADYTATTETAFVSAVSATGIPQVFDYGGQVLAAAAPTSEATGPDFTLTPDEQRRLVLRLLVSGVGAVVVMGFMIVVGAFIFFLYLRRRPTTRYAPTGTGQYPAIAPRQTETGRYAVVQPSDEVDRDTQSPSDNRAYLNDDEPEDNPFRPPQ